MLNQNQKIREAANLKCVKLWEIADRLNLNDGNFSRKLRKELPPEEQDRILKIIDEICLEHRRNRENEQAKND